MPSSTAQPVHTGIVRKWILRATRRHGCDGADRHASGSPPRANRGIEVLRAGHEEVARVHAGGHGSRDRDAGAGKAQQTWAAECRVR
jgi:hypothetical protein